MWDCSTYAALLALRRGETRRAEEDRDRRAAESPASRQARLASNSEKKRERRAAESPASRQGVRGLYLMKYGCPNNNSNIVAKRLLINPAGEGPAGTRAVQG